jgi:hypothetical protein
VRKLFLKELERTARRGGGKAGRRDAERRNGATPQQTIALLLGRQTAWCEAVGQYLVFDPPPPKQTSRTRKERGSTLLAG